MGATKKKLTGAAKYAPQVRAEALLRFGPQESAIASRIADARGVRSQARGTAASTARVVGAAVDNADVQVQKVFAPAFDTAQHASDLVTTSREIQALPDGSALKAALAEGTAGAQARLAQTLAAARTDLAARRTQAVAGAEYAKRQADQVYAGELARAHRDVAALASQEGAFAQGRLGQLLGDQTKLNHDTAKQRRAQSFTHSENALKRQAARDKANAGRLPGGAMPVNAKAQGALEDAYKQAATLVKQLRGAGVPDHVIGDLLVSGRPATIDKTKYAELVARGMSPTDARVQAQVGAVPKQSPLAVEIALDLADGRISRKLVAKLHRRGYAVAPFGKTGRPTLAGAVGGTGLGSVGF